MSGFTMADYRRQQAAQAPRPAAPQPTPKPSGGGDVGNAFWINPYGEILDIGHAKHITSMINAPEKFGFSREEIFARHEEAGEKVGIEGKVREEMIKEVMQKGFIHIRLYPSKFWAVNLWRYHKRAKQTLSKWAEKAMTHGGAGKNMPVRIYSLESDEIVANTTTQDLYYGMGEAVEGFDPKIVESVADFRDYVPEALPTFKEYIG